MLIFLNTTLNDQHTDNSLMIDSAMEKLRGVASGVSTLFDQVEVSFIPMGMDTPTTAW